MSHRDDCPTRWQAEREGEQAAGYGSGSWRNPYRSSFSSEDECPEAARAWEDGRRSEERRMEERQQEEREREAEHRRREQEAEWRAEEERAYYEQMQAEQYPEQQPPEPQPQQPDDPSAKPTGGGA